MSLEVSQREKVALLEAMAEMIVQVCFKCKTEGTQFLERY